MPTPIDTFLNPPAAPPAAAPEAAPPRPPAGPIDLFLNPPADPARAGQDLRLSEFRRQYAAAPDRGEEPLEYLARRGVPFASAAAGTAEKNVYAAARRRFDEGRATDYDLHAIAQFERDERDRQQGQKSFLGELAHAGASAPAVIGEFAAGGALLRGAGLFTQALPKGAPLAQRAGRLVAETAAKTPLLPSQYAERAAQNALEKGGEATDAKNLAPALLHGALNVAVLGSLQKVANGVSPAALRVGAKGGIGVLEQAGVDVVAGAAGLQTGYGVLGDLANGKRGEALQHAAVQALTFSAFALAHGRPEESKKILDTAAETLNQQARSGVTPDRAAGKVTADLPESPTEAAKAYQKGEEKARQSEQRPTPGETPESGNVATPADPLAHWSDQDVWDLAVQMTGEKSKGKVDRQKALQALKAKGVDLEHLAEMTGGKPVQKPAPPETPPEAPQVNPEPVKPPEPAPTPESPSTAAVGPQGRPLSPGEQIGEDFKKAFEGFQGGAIGESYYKATREAIEQTGDVLSTDRRAGGKVAQAWDMVKKAGLDRQPGALDRFMAATREAIGQGNRPADWSAALNKHFTAEKPTPAVAKGGAFSVGQQVKLPDGTTGEVTRVAPEHGVVRVKTRTPTGGSREGPFAPDQLQSVPPARGPETPLRAAMREAVGDRAEDLGAALGSETYTVPHGDRFIAVRQTGDNRVSIDFDYAEARPGSLTAPPPKGLAAGTTALVRDMGRIVRAMAARGVEIEYTASPVKGEGGRTSRADFYARQLEKAGYEMVRAGGPVVPFVWEPKKAAESNRPELIPQPKPAPESGNVATGREAVLARYPAPTGRGNVATDPGASLARVRAAQAARPPVPFRAPPKVERPIDTGEAIYHGEEMLSDAATTAHTPESAAAVLEIAFHDLKVTPAEQHVLRQRLLGRTHEDITADPEVRKADGSAYTRQRIQQLEASALEKLGIDRETAAELVRDPAGKYHELAKLVGRGELSADPNEVSPVRQKRTKAERDDEEQTQAFIREAESAKRRGINTADAERVAGVTHGRRPQGPAGPQEAGGAQPPLGAGQAQRAGEAPVRRGGRRGTSAPPGEPAPQAAGEENAAVAARPPGPRAGEVPGAEPGAGGRDDLAAAAVRGAAAGNRVDPDLATRRPGKGETRIGRVGDRVRYDPEQHDLEPGGGTKATGEVVRAGIRDADGNVLRKPLVRRHALQDEEAAFRAAKAREEEAAYHEEQARAASEGPVPDHPDLSFEFGHLGLPEPPPTGANEVGGVPGRNGPLGVRQANPQGEFALAREKVTREREQRSLPPVAEAARRSNPQGWAQATAEVAANPRAGYELVDKLEADPQSVRPDADVPLLLLHRVALSNAHDKAVSDYNQRAGQFGFVGGEMRRTATEAELEPLRRRAEDLAHERNRLDGVTAAVGTQLGRGLQYFRQLAREDYSLSGMLGQAKFAKGGQDLTPGEATRVAAAHQEVTRADKALEGAEGGNVATGGVDLADLRIAVRKARRGWADTLADLKLAGGTRTQKVIAGAREGLNASRSLITSMDFSAVFRQGGFLSLGHPVRAAKALPDMFRAFVSSKSFERQQDNIRRRDNSLNGLYDRSGLYLAEIDARPTAQEEAFVGRLARNIPGVAASERAYVSFLNRLRADTFDSMVSGLSRGGRPTTAEAKAVANFVNVATGRGGLGPLENAAQPLAQIFFSPRYVASRFQILAGQPLYGGNVATRKLVAQEYARFLAGVGVFTALALAADDKAKYTLDPRSSDFGKIRMGNTRIDPLTGLSQAGVFVTRGATGETRSATSGRQSDLRGAGVRFGGQTEESVFTRFVRSKLAPIPGVLGDVYTGQKVTGERITAPVALPGGATVPRGTGAAVAREAGQLLVPMAGRDVYEALEDQGVPRGAAAGLLGIFGMGSQTFQPNKK